MLYGYVGYVCVGFFFLTVAETLHSFEEGTQLWLDVDNVLADSRERIRSHVVDGILQSSFKYPSEVIVDPVLPRAVEVCNRFFWRGSKVNIITARKSWPNALNTTNAWLQQHGFLYHSIHLTNSADDKVDILSRVCTAKNSCIFIDDLRSGWHTLPVGENTHVKLNLVNIYRKLPYIELELFHQPGFNTWIDIENKYLGPDSLTSPLLLRSGVFGHLRGELHNHVNRSKNFVLSTTTFHLLWIVKQNPLYQSKTFYEQLGVKTSTLLTIPWAETLQILPLQQNQMVNSIPGVIEMFGTKGAMYANAREELSLKSFRFPVEMENFRVTAELMPGTRWVYKPDNLSNGIGIYVGTADEILKKPSNGTGVIQQFIHNPLLSRDGKKVDFRYYVLVSSMDSSPLRSYFNKNGYVRVAGSSFSESASTESQILNSGKSRSTRISTREFWENQVVNTSVRIEKVQENIIKAISSVIGGALPRHLGCKSKRFSYNCEDIRFQLIGVDLGIDVNDNVHIFEFGFDPSLKVRSGDIRDNDIAMYSEILSIMEASLRAERGVTHVYTEVNRAQAESKALNTFVRMPIN